MSITLADSRYLSLETRKRDGSVVLTPVWFADTDEQLFIFSAGAAGKVKRIRNDPSVRVAPCGVAGKLLGPWQCGEARLLLQADEQRLAHRALRRRYGWQMRLLDYFSGLFGHRSKRAWIALRLDS